MMINLFEMMQKAQGGQAVNELARQFGLTPQQSEAAVDAILPAFTIALRQQLKNPQAWPYLVAALSIPPGQPGTLFQAFSPQGLQQGQQLMSALFGSPQLGQQIAAQAASATGLNAALMQQMMPAMAAMLTGGAWKTFGNAIASTMEAFAGAMGAGAGKPEARPASTAPAFPMGIPENWGEIVGELVGGKPEPKPDAAKADEPNMFDPAGIGPMLQRMMDRAAQSASRTAPQAAPARKSAASKAAAAPKAPAPKPEPAPEPEPEPAAEAAKPEAAPSRGTPDFDAFTRMIETGREVQQQHLRNLQALMGQVWGAGHGDTAAETDGKAGSNG